MIITLPVFYSTDELTDDFLPRRRHSLDHVTSDCKSLYWDTSSSSSSSESDESEFYSPCQAYFQTRYVIGTNKPTKKVMDFFPSENGKYRYVSWVVIVDHGLFVFFPKKLKLQKKISAIFWSTDTVRKLSYKDGSAYIYTCFKIDSKSLKFEQLVKLRCEGLLF
jgi:hypothetical protein